MEYKTSVNDVESIVGTWTGKVKQVLFGKDIEYDVKLDLRQDGDKITGNAILGLSDMHLEDEAGNPIQSAAVSINGIFYENRFLQLNYKNSSEIHQFGYIVIDLYDSTIKPDHTIKGLFIGYGPKSKKVINGEVVFKKLMP